MPILTIELVVDGAGAPQPGLAAAIADGVGRALDSPAGRTWVRLHVLDRTHYAENGASRATDELPVFVTVLKRRVPVEVELEAEAALLAEVIAEAVGRPVACVHVEFAPAALHRVAFGGKLVR